MKTIKLFSAICLTLGLASSLQAAFVDYWFRETSESTVYEIYAHVTGDDTAGLAAFSFQFEVPDSSLVSWTINPYLDGLTSSYQPHGFTTQVSGPSGPTIFSATAAQSVAGPAIFGVGINPLTIPGPAGPTPEIGKIVTGVPAYLGRLDLGGQTLGAGAVTADVGLYDLSGESDGFLPPESIDPPPFVCAAVGCSSGRPILPDNDQLLLNEDGQWVFDNVDVSNQDLYEGFWFDPVPAYAFVYETTDEVSLFGSLRLPSGLGDSHSAYIVQSSQGVFALEPGDVHTFDSPGVSSFTISDIDPSVEGESALAFPTRLYFSQTQPGGLVSFTMTPIPEPSALALAGLVLLALAGYRRRKR